MAKIMTMNYSDTAISGVSTLSLPLSVLNFGADWVMQQSVADKAVAVNMLSPADRPETLMWGISSLSNVYAGKGIEAPYQSQSKKGYSIVVQLANYGTVTDSTDPSYTAYEPFTTHVVFRFPAIEQVTGSVLKAQLGRLADACFNSGVVTDERLTALIMKSMLPTALR